MLYVLSCRNGETRTGSLKTQPGDREGGRHPSVERSRKAPFGQGLRTRSCRGS